MKLFKKLMSYFIALTMVLSLATLLGGNVHAAGGTTDTGTTGNSLTIKNNGETAHTFELYQIFTGTKNKDDALGDIQWGSGVSEEGQTTLGNAANKAETLKVEADAKAFAKALADGGYLQNPSTSTSVVVNSTYTFDNLATGYYLVKDKANSQADSNGLKNSSYTEYICKVVGKTDAETKLDVPSVEKKVKDKDDSAGTTSGWQDSADYDIGDSIPYKLTATLGTKYGDYKTYKLEFVDNLGAGLNYDTEVAYKVTVDTEDGADITNAFSKSEDGKKITWTCNDLKTVKDKDQKAVTISAGSKIIVTYNAKLNDSAVIGAEGNPNTVYLKYSNNPNYTGEGENSPEGQTPTDKNIVFTYKTVVNKVDKDNHPLKGAAFKLEKKTSAGTYTLVKELPAGDATTFEFTGLDDGNYKLTETTTPAGYNSIAPIEFTINATHDETSDDPKLTELSVSNVTGEATFTASTTAGSLTTNVVNKKGSELPSTGGMGTTLLYVAGGILVACAAAYVVLNKKRA